MITESHGATRSTLAQEQGKAQRVALRVPLAGADLRVFLQPDLNFWFLLPGSGQRKVSRAALLLVVSGGCSIVPSSPPTCPPGRHTRTTQARPLRSAVPGDFSAMLDCFPDDGLQLIRADINGEGHDGASHIQAVVTATGCPTFFLFFPRG